MQENKTYYLYVKGQRVEVSEQIYRAYVQPERKQRMREYRAKEKISVTSIEALSEKGFEPEDGTQDFESALIEVEEQSEELAKLNAAIEQLSERDRRVVQLYYFESKTQQEIANILGIAKSTMSELLPRILLRLKNLL
jgi:RNA polymerase sigma factor (sigma-70 family)